jgi:heptosyltransferase-2
MGDVLRTTCIIDPILREWPGARITWITETASIPLLESLPSVAEVVPADYRAVALLASQSFDAVFGLDTGAHSARLTALARAPLKKGFGIGENGVVRPLNQEAEEWYQMGLFDHLKQSNLRTYQDLIQQACSLNSAMGRILYRTTEEERVRAQHRVVGWKVNGRSPVIGLNIGSGGRWVTKRWPLGNWEILVSELRAKWPYAVVFLLGGSEEREDLERLSQTFACDSVVNTGCDNSVRDFAALVDLCDVVVTGDTLALHLALALSRRVVAFFGPTSAVEVELYGLGEKLLSPEGCDCFYRHRCRHDIPCLAKLEPSSVLAAVERQVNC